MQRIRSARVLAVLLLLVGQLYIDDLQSISGLGEQSLCFVQKTQILDKVAQLIHVLGALQFQLGVKWYSNEIGVLLQGQREHAIDLDATEKTKFGYEWLLQAFGRCAIDETIQKGW